MSEPNQAEGAEKPAGKLKKLMIIPLALCALVGGGFVTFTQYPLVARVVATKDSGDAAEAEEAKVPVEYGAFHQFDGFTVNAVGADGSHYLMVNIGVEARKESILEELKGREIVVRDTVIKLLSARSAEELAILETRSVLKDQVRQAFNGILSEGTVDRIYFTQYVLQ